MSVLAATGITKSFSAIPALADVSIHVEPGESVGLIGPNGAGKTTLFNVLLGVIAPDEGAVEVMGHDVSQASVHERARLGVGRTFQRLELFGSMTPRQHLLVAAQARRRPGILADLLGRGRPTDDEECRATELLALVGLREVADDPIESLSLGLARMVELGRALMNEPQLLLLDEPSSGLDRSEASRFADVLDQVRAERDTALLFVEHDLDLVLRIVSRLYVMDAGRVLVEGDAAEVMASDVVRAAYLGDLDDLATSDAAVASTGGPKASAVPPRADSDRPTLDVRDPGPGTADAGASPLLQICDVYAAYGEFRALFGVTFSVRAGSVTALLGSNGAGKTTVARVCSGLIAPTAGSVIFDGEDVSGRSAYELARAGIAHVAEGRSVFATLSVEENLELSFRALEGRAAVAHALERAYDLFPRLGERRRQTAATLSGGEQRMLSLARAFPHPPRLLIADELSLGLAPIVVDEVFATLERLRDEGTAILIVEQHAAKALALADDVVVLATGEVAHQGPVSELGDGLDGLLPVHAPTST